ncbi:STAS domain-containing protein [Streptomyces sp. ME19-01-6]|uniref:STAS domain-containing protein n=1 Tax=Streptomyces sp. ME19-01-6 TaxID=3028686 RepID=UPI0029BB2F20|nr:STAS domain-containing protein [Streptomyces sp. ME19-01-6]MDX3227992.1 STAS domain-containing protein [Streptomyces sp. ME19-01-6]
MSAQDETPAPRGPAPDAAGGTGDHAAGAPAVLVLDPAVGRADVPGLCARLRELASHGAGAGPVVVDVGAVRAPDLAVVEALARLQLAARRLGSGILLRGVSGELRAVLARSGLDTALPTAGLPGVGGAEAGGQAEEREEAGGVQEGVERGDPAG